MKRLFALPLIAALTCAMAPAASALAADQLRIGFLSTLSGPGGAISIDIRDGFNLAVKTNGGKLGGIDLDLQIVDDQLKPDVAKKPEAVFIFLPGGMGINFIKQFSAAGLGKSIQLFVPGYSADEDTIKAVGESLLGTVNTSFWAHDMDNAANKRFVADFEKTYGRLPTMYAAQVTTQPC